MQRTPRPHGGKPEGHHQITLKRGRLFTPSFADGKPRFWNPHHSKMAVLLQKEPELPLQGIANILYLGGGHGTTVSHLSDLFPHGTIFVVEFGITIDGIIELAKERSNIYPIMEDASNPSHYKHLVGSGSVDLLYQDIAQRDQPGILLSNMQFLKRGGLFIFMVKIRSIAQDKGREHIAQDMIRRLKEYQGLHILGVSDLEPYKKDHLAIFGEKT